MQSANNAKQMNMKSHQKIKFSQEEDQKLIELVNLYGENNWGTITLFMQGRNIRQCRERWKHYLSPYVSNAPWTEIEDQLLIQKYIEYGPKWKKIAEFFPKRTYINIKNRFLLKKRHNERLSTQIVEISAELVKKMVDKKKKCISPYLNCNNVGCLNNFNTPKNKIEKKQNNIIESDCTNYQYFFPQIKTQTIDVETFNDDIDDFLTENNVILSNYDEFYFPI